MTCCEKLTIYLRLTCCDMALFTQLWALLAQSGCPVVPGDVSSQSMITSDYYYKQLSFSKQWPWSTLEKIRNESLNHVLLSYYFLFSLLFWGKSGKKTGLSALFLVVTDGGWEDKTLINKYYQFDYLHLHDHYFHFAFHVILFLKNNQVTKIVLTYNKDIFAN